MLVGFITKLMKPLVLDCWYIKVGVTLIVYGIVDTTRYKTLYGSLLLFT